MRIIKTRDRFQQNINDKYNTVKEEMEEQENKDPEIDRMVRNTEGTSANSG